MAGYYTDGKTIDWTNDAGVDVAAKTFVVVGKQVGVAHDDIANGETGVVHMEGVWGANKASSDVFAQGSVVNFNFSTQEFQTASSDVDNICIAWKAASAGDATFYVKINTPGSP